jgi:DNA-binding response OmpR family regulator
MKIAVVDDDYTTRTLISEFLEDVGYVTKVEKSPAQLQSIEGYDAVVMDVRIGNDRYAGIDYVLEQRRTGKLGLGTPVIFISNFGRGTAEIEGRLQKVGSYEWLNKPIEFTELDQTLRRLLGKKAAQE